LRSKTGHEGAEFGLVPVLRVRPQGVHQALGKLRVAKGFHDQVRAIEQGFGVVRAPAQHGLVSLVGVGELLQRLQLLAQHHGVLPEVGPAAQHALAQRGCVCVLPSGVQV
jgi:hypothetical protein